MCSIVGYLEGNLLTSAILFGYRLSLFAYALLPFAHRLLFKGRCRFYRLLSFGYRLLTPKNIGYFAVGNCRKIEMNDVKAIGECCLMFADISASEITLEIFGCSYVVIGL